MSAALNLPDTQRTRSLFHVRRGPDAIIARVAAKHRLGYSDLVGSYLYPNIVAARWEAIKKVHRAYPTWSLARIGRAFGGRDHTSILNAFRKMGLTPAGVACRERIWTEADDNLIRTLWPVAQSVKAIAVEIGVTSRTILRRADTLGLEPRPQRTPAKRLTVEQVRYILSSRERPGVVARRFGIARATVWDIRHGKSWKWVGANGQGRTEP